jgi:hypothetical protein
MKRSQRSRLVNTLKHKWKYSKMKIDPGFISHWKTERKPNENPMFYVMLTVSKKFDKRVTK